MRAEASRGREAPVVFVDAREMPDAYEIAGRYGVEDGQVTVTAVLFRGEEEVASFTVAGPKTELAGLARRLAREALARAPR